jgi:hypothetical protein
MSRSHTSPCCDRRARAAAAHYAILESGASFPFRLQQRVHSGSLPTNRRWRCTSGHPTFFSYFIRIWLYAPRYCMPPLRSTPDVHIERKLTCRACALRLVSSDRICLSHVMAAHPSHTAPPRSSCQPLAAQWTCSTPHWTAWMPKAGHFMGSSSG